MPHRYAVSSVHKQGGKPNLFCSFYDPEGYRRFRSTGTADIRIAKTICNAIEHAAELTRKGQFSADKSLKLIRQTCTTIEEGRGGKLAADQAQRVLKASFDEFVLLAGGEVQSFTVRSWLHLWLSGRTEASKATVTEYGRAVRLFLKFLGARADRSMNLLQTVHVENFKAAMVGRVGPSTVNKTLIVLKMAFGDAVRRRHLEFSPAEHVTGIDAPTRDRRKFTPEEVRKVLAVAEPEWRTMTMIGYYTGLRLRDCANLNWSNVDLQKGTIALTVEKTGRTETLPLHDSLAAHFHELAGDKPNSPLCPGLAGKTAKFLSGQFYKRMIKAGIVEPRRAGKPRTSNVSFHSLRHLFISQLSDEGVRPEIRMKLAGHRSAEVHENYTDPEPVTLKNAVNKLPDITR